MSPPRLITLEWIDEMGDEPNVVLAGEPCVGDNPAVMPGYSGLRPLHGGRIGGPERAGRVVTNRHNG